MQLNDKNISLITIPRHWPKDLLFLLLVFFLPEAELGRRNTEEEKEGEKMPIWFKSTFMST